MRTLAFDGRMGAAGDMICAALVDAGADPAVLEAVEDALPVRYVIEATDAGGVAATTVDVVREDSEPDGDRHEADSDREKADDDRDGEFDSSGEHGSDHDRPPAEGHGPHRRYAEVVELVESMSLSDSVREDALAIFEILGEAEAGVHGTELESTRFHEVGADDAVADVVGACLLLDDLGVERVVTTPLSAGAGSVETSHGTYPVPTPAVVEIAARATWSLRGGPVDAELLTPTGAAVLAHLADGVERLPSIRVAASGHGAGSLRFPDRPNVLRALLGEGEAALVRDDVTVLETNLDDATPEVLGSLHETLTEAGARDVSVLPATMKKSRPGHLVKVVVKPEDAERVARRLAAETGTLGVREHGAGHRWIAERSFETATIEVDGERYEVPVKVARDADGDVYDVSAEYDDALAAATESGAPLRTVLRRAEARVEARLD